MPGQRGLVVSAPIETATGSLMVKNAALDPQELRFSLLFWDKLDSPSNSVMRLSSAETEILVSGSPGALRKKPPGGHALVRMRSS